MEVARLKSEVDLVFPKGFSFFGPYLRYYVREVLRIGGEAYVSTGSDGGISGLFMYDDFERAGTIYTLSREVFDYFYGLKQFDYLFAELRTEKESETYDIYTADLENVPGAHRFRHEMSMADDRDAEEIERFMVATAPRVNRLWVRIALRNGEKCFMTRLCDEIAGLGWVSMVDGIGRLHSLYVKPRFRRMGIGEDILFARLFWLRLRRARSVFSEISRLNAPSSRIAVKAQMRVTGQIFQYFGKSSNVGEERIGQDGGRS